MNNKKAQMGMHMFGFADIFIVLFGVILGVALVWYGLGHGLMPASMFCP